MILILEDCFLNIFINQNIKLQKLFFIKWVILILLIVEWKKISLKMDSQDLTNMLLYYKE